eukprot:COSAG04_NODE_1653_length_6046_cov_6.955608_6_plen_129_part_00
MAERIGARNGTGGAVLREIMRLGRNFWARRVWVDFRKVSCKTIFMNHPLLLKCPGGARVAVDDDAVDDGARVVRPWRRRGPRRAVAHSVEVADALIQRCPRSMRATSAAGSGTCAIRRRRGWQMVVGP